MTAAPVMSFTDELIAELEAAANAAIAERAAYIAAGERGLEWNRKRIGFQELATDAVVLALLAERAELKQKYRWLQKVTPYKFKKMQDASTTDGGDVLYFHENRFDIEVHAAMQAAQ
jgi:hypothetical protein